MISIPINLVQDAPTRITGHMFDLPKGQTRTFKGGPLGLHRKWIHICNDDEGTPLYIIRHGSDPGAPIRIAKVKRNETLTLFTSDDITIAAPDEALDITGTIGAVKVMEAFYV